MSDGSIDFILDLDGKEFTAGIAEAREKVEKLIEATKEIGIAAGLVGAAYLALKTTLDLTLEAESIRAINDQFERLTANAGIAGEALKEGLIHASGGLIDDTELMKAANRSIIEMGASAANLPSLMEVARKATAALGGDLLQNFEALNHAISSGSQRGLRQLGLTTLDVDKAYRDYARTLGIAVDAMSEAEKRQGLMNAALTKSKTAYAGVNPDIQEAHNLLKQTKVTITEVGEALTLAFDSIFGTTVKNYLKGIQEMAAETKRFVTANYGEGQEKAIAQAERAREKVNALKGEIIDLEQVQLRVGRGDPYLAGQRAEEMDRLKVKLQEYQAELVKADAKVIKPEAKAEGGTSGEGGGKAAELDDATKERRLKSEYKFQADLTQLKNSALQADMANAMSIEQVEAQAAMQKLLIEEQTQAKINEMRFNTSLNEDQKRQEILIIEQTAAAQKLAIEDQLVQKKIAALDLYERKAVSSSDAIARAAEAGAKKAVVAQTNYGAEGARRLDSFNKHFEDSFHELGSGQRDAAEVAKGIVFGMLADEADARAKLMLAQSLFPPNPLGIAAAGGLFALAGLLRSQAKGSGSSSASGGGGGGAISSGAGSSAATADDSRPSVAAAQEKKTVTLQVMGNYFETEATKTRLVEMIREASDATDFNIKQVGG